MKAVVAGRHPRLVEGEEFSIGHLGRGHGELAIGAAGDVARDRYATRLVGPDETCGRIVRSGLDAGRPSIIALPTSAGAEKPIAWMPLATSSI